MRAGKHSRLFFCVALSFALAAAGCTRKDAGEEQLVQKISADTLRLSEDAIRNIKIEKAESGEFPEELAVMGRISVPEDRIAVIPARVSGRIDSVYVASGEVVGKGQPMASLFSADFAIAREEYIQALRQGSDQPESKRLLELSKRKLDAIGMSAVDIETLSAAEGAKGENLTVRSPRSGALLDKKAMVGTFVNQGDTLFTIGDLSKVWFAGDIYPEDLKRIHKSQEVQIEAAAGGAALNGKVSFISPVVDPTTRTIKIRALIENPGNQLRADMYVRGNLILSKRNALTAPKSALVRLRDSLFCFKRLPGNQFKRVEVTVDGETGNRVAISKGLSDGDEVVSEGALLLDAALSGGAT